MEKHNGTPVYLAGPDIFRPNPTEFGKTLKAICLEFGLTGQYPLDNQIDLSGLDNGPAKGLKIFQADIQLINQSEAVVANISPFRGISADPGTAVEIGYAVALGKPVVVYSDDLSVYSERAAELGFGGDGWELEDFGLSDNLMLMGGSIDQKVHGSFRDAVEALSDYLWVLKNGTLESK